MNDYVTLSLESHLFFARIMKEHSLFLEAGFPCCEKDFIEEAGRFRRKFEELLKDAVKIADGRIQESVLNSGELVTEFTFPAEKRTMSLSGIPIDTRITEETRQLSRGCPQNTDRPLYQPVRRINERAYRLLGELIRFKERIVQRERPDTAASALPGQRCRHPQIRSRRYSEEHPL